MARRRSQLNDLEVEIVEARSKLRDGYAPGRHYWHGHLAWCERAAKELRSTITEALRP